MPGENAAFEQLVRTEKGPLVLLFYDGYELKAADGAFGKLGSEARRIARYAWRSLRRKQVHTGFYAAFLGLKRSLAAIGCDVRVNDFALARRMPEYPIGLAGYPSVLEKVRLPNPVIFGPGDYGSREEAAELAKQPRMRRFIQPSPWFRDFYEPMSAGKTVSWFAGIDTAAWPDWSAEPKTLDVLIYDKIRWRREERVPQLLDTLTALLARKGLSHEILRYGGHHHSQFAAALKRARSLAFLCEHETQGLAYQEAMSANVPVFAWDEGELVDPTLAHLPAPGVSSVPYFDARCGLRFKAAEIEPAFENFWCALPSYRPRDYVEETLALRHAGRNYVELYATLRS